jgi:hypothetical protein
LIAPVLKTGVPSRGPWVRIPPSPPVNESRGGYQPDLRGFTRGPKAPHFLVGKHTGEVAQLVDTTFSAAHVGPIANNLYLGIEFESIPATPGARGQDPKTIADELTPFQTYQGRDIVDWLCKTHGIPKIGPPTHAQWMQCGGRWRGVLGHANVADGGFFRTDHGDTLIFVDFIALSVWPK